MCHELLFTFSVILKYKTIFYSQPVQKQAED